MPRPYLNNEHDHANNHKSYLSSREITINDLYSIDHYLHVDAEEVTKIIGRNFKQPKEGLGFDSRPRAHKWRSINGPNDFL